jgi:hypothetical protein
VGQQESYCDLNLCGPGLAGVLSPPVPRVSVTPVVIIKVIMKLVPSLLLLVLLILLGTVWAGGQDPIPPFRQVIHPIPILAAEKMVGDKNGGFYVAESIDDLDKLFPGERRACPLIVGTERVAFEHGEVLVIFILKLKKNADITVTSCRWYEKGGACVVRYKRGPDKPGLNIKVGDKRVEFDYVTTVVGVVTKRPRPKPVVWPIDEQAK